MSDLGDELIRQYKEQRVVLADRLRSIADEVEGQHSDPRIDLRSELLDYPESSQRILRNLMWGVANLQLDELQRKATMIDRELRREHQDG